MGDNKIMIGRGGTKIKKMVVLLTVLIVHKRMRGAIRDPIPEEKIPDFDKRF